MDALHALVRVLAWVNLILAFLAACVVPYMFWAWTMVEDRTQAIYALVYTAVFFVFFVLLLMSGLGLKNQRPWSRWLTVVVGGIIGAEGIWHLIRAEWGAVLFCFAYAVLVGWTLLTKACEGYFQNE